MGMEKVGWEFGETVRGPSSELTADCFKSSVRQKYLALSQSAVYVASARRQLS